MLVAEIKKLKKSGRGQISHRGSPHLTEPKGGGFENEQTFACFEAPLLAANGPHTYRCRLGAGAFRALRVARLGRHQGALDGAMESLRSRVRQMVRQVRQ